MLVWSGAACTRLGIYDESCTYTLSGLLQVFSVVFEGYAYLQWSEHEVDPLSQEFLLSFVSCEEPVLLLRPLPFGRSLVANLLTLGNLFAFLYHSTN